MASTGTGGTLPPNFLLTPQQQSLLFAALNSNKQQASGSAGSNTISPTSFQKSSAQRNAGHHAGAGPHESPYLDNYDYDFGDSSFDFSFATDDQPSMIGDLPSSATPASGNLDSADLDGAEKRSHPDDESDDSSPGADPKRRESSDKAPKKPGRKPLTSEPSSKRKAQNRAAQRAFRERKEKHLKDLETKVEELEKASQAANHENGILRSRVEQMTTQLNQYKQKITLMSNPKTLPREKVPFGSAAVSNLNDVNFQFEFPKFGMLPGPPVAKQQTPGSQTASPHQQTMGRSSSSSFTNEDKSPQSLQKEDLAKFSGVFSPSMSSSATNPSRASVDSANFSNNGATSSPSASSQSNNGPSSSCGTSPEPFTQSPLGSKPLETLTTIGEEQTSLPLGDLAGQTDLNKGNFDWLSQQNGGQFDPQLFGGYREPQESILANPSFDDFFNDALDADFFTAYNMAPSPNTALNIAGAGAGANVNDNVHADAKNMNGVVHKKNLIDEIDAQQDSYDDEPLKKESMNCNQLWEKLQSYPNAQNGDFDLDGLCWELTKKAKCSGKGPVVEETDFDTILGKYMGKTASNSSIAGQLGIELAPEKK